VNGELTPRAQSLRAGAGGRSCFHPSLPIRVHEVTASVAANASGPVMSVTDNQLSIDSATAT